jgi:cyclic pyranopterin phosphate synthase
LLTDQFGRHLHYLRVSLTDACNFRCVYCMPENIRFKNKKELMQNEELLLLTRAFVDLGVDKIRLTGGEPMLRDGLISIISSIKEMGVRDLSMTTNGSLLADSAEELARAGLDRVNISLDSLDPAKFRRITRRGSFEDVWEGIFAAEQAGLTPIKINVVVVRGYNDEDVVDLARLTLDHPWEVRFIELMPLGSEGDFALESLVPSGETREKIESALGPLEAVPGYNGEDPSRPYRIPGAPGRLGFISSVTAPFCAGCTRLRLTADGRLRLCLLHEDEVDLLTPLRKGASYEEIKSIIKEAAWRKPWGHRLDEAQFPLNREMSQIGG